MSLGRISGSGLLLRRYLSKGIVLEMQLSGRAGCLDCLLMLLGNGICSSESMPEQSLNPVAHGWQVVEAVDLTKSLKCGKGQAAFAWICRDLN